MKNVKKNFNAKLFFDVADIDTESYFSKLVSWLNGLNITSWTAKQVII